MSRLRASFLATLAALSILAGCSTIEDIEGEPISTSLAKYNYVLVDVSPNTYTYVVCGDVRDREQCYERRGELATTDHPVVEANSDGVVTKLIGVRPRGDDRNYTMVVPDEWQRTPFADQHPSNQRILLTIMPYAIKSYNESALTTVTRLVPTPITEAEVSLELIS